MTQKLRVYQVAKDFKVSSEALLGILESLGVPAKSHMSTLDASVVDLVREYGLKDHVIEGTDRTVVACIGDKRSGSRSLSAATIAFGSGLRGTKSSSCTSRAAARNTSSPSPSRTVRSNGSASEPS